MGFGKYFLAYVKWVKSDQVYLARRPKWIEFGLRKFLGPFNIFAYLHNSTCIHKKQIDRIYD